jgi:UDP-glucose 4-epimerase
MTSVSGAVSREIERVAIVGVSTHWGRELAEVLAHDERIGSIIGIDTRPPESLPEGVEFIEADIRNPVITRLLPDLAPDVVVHCGIIWYPEEGRPSRALHDINVIGTLNLLAACEKVENLSAVVVRGSAAIYGTAPARPVFFTEEMARDLPLVTRFQRDIGELEGYFENFTRRRPGVTCCMLRFQAEVGPDLDSPLVRYLSLPVVPVQLGFDPLLQILHPVDATGALAAAVVNPVDGPVNVAPDGSISLSRLLRLAGKIAIPLPPIVSGALFKRLGGLLDGADMYRDGELLMRFGRGCDNTRIRKEVGYRFAFNTEGAARDFASGRPGPARFVHPPRPGAGVRVVP